MTADAETSNRRHGQLTASFVDYCRRTPSPVRQINRTEVHYPDDLPESYGLPPGDRAVGLHQVGWVAANQVCDQDAVAAFSRRCGLRVGG